MRKPFRELKKTYNGSVCLFNPSIKPTTKKSVKDICNTVSLPESLSSEQIISDLRKGQD